MTRAMNTKVLEHIVTDAHDALFKALRESEEEVSSQFLGYVSDLYEVLDIVFDPPTDQLRKTFGGIPNNEDPDSLNDLLLQHVFAREVLSGCLEVVVPSRNSEEYTPPSESELASMKIRALSPTHARGNQDLSVYDLREIRGLGYALGYLRDSEGVQHALEIFGWCGGVKGQKLETMAEIRAGEVGESLSTPAELAKSAFIVGNYYYSILGVSDGENADIEVFGEDCPERKLVCSRKELWDLIIILATTAIVNRGESKDYALSAQAKYWLASEASVLGNEEVVLLRESILDTKRALEISAEEKGEANPDYLNDLGYTEDQLARAFAEISSPEAETHFRRSIAAFQSAVEARDSAYDYVGRADAELDLAEYLRNAKGGSGFEESVALCESAISGLSKGIEKELGLELNLCMGRGEAKIRLADILRDKHAEYPSLKERIQTLYREGIHDITDGKSFEELTGVLGLGARNLSWIADAQYGLALLSDDSAEKRSLLNCALTYSKVAFEENKQEYLLEKIAEMKRLLGEE